MWPKPNHRINEHKILKIEHEQVMLVLQKLTMMFSEAVVKCNELAEDIKSYK